VVRLKESPKYLLAKGQDADVVRTFQYIAQKYNRPCSLTLEELEACGTILPTYGKSRYGFGELMAHLRGLFATKKMGISTTMIWFSWLLIGNDVFGLQRRKLVFADFFQVSPTRFSTYSSLTSSPVAEPKLDNLVLTTNGEIT
jgi:hypothetical protein